MMAEEHASQNAAPALPPGWEDAADRLFRIASADGNAVAWICPEIGGNTVAYAVRAGGRWAQLLDIAPPATLTETPSRFGLPILFPFPGHMRHRRYQWNGREIEVPPTFPGTDAVTHGFAHVRPWRLVRQAPARVTCELRTPGDLDAAQAASYPFAVRLTVDVTFGAEATDELVVTLIAVNEGDAPAPVAFGLHPYFGEDLLGADRTLVHVDLPGASERVRTGEPAPYMTGERTPAPANPVSIVPLGQTMATGRTGFGRRDYTARIIDLPAIDGRTGWTVELAMYVLRAARPELDLAGAAEPQARLRLNAGGPPGRAGRPGARRDAGSGLPHPAGPAGVQSVTMRS